MKNNQSQKPAKQTKKSFNISLYIFSIILATVTAISTFVVIVYFNVSGLFDSIYFLYIIPVLMVILIILIPTLFNSYFKNFAKLEQSLSSVADGDFTTRINTQKSGPFEESFKNFNKMAEELEKNNLLKDGFIHSYSHELKTPIASIKGFADLILEENLSKEDREKYLRIISTEAERLTRLSENTLFVSKLSSQSIIQNKSVYELGEQIRHAVSLLDREISSKNIDIFAEINDVKIYGSYELIQEVWINLISNAIKFSKEGGKIEISLNKDDLYAIFSIKDYGIGISESDQQKIFSPYYQVDTSHFSSGFGLGLSIVKKIVTLCDGEILLDSKLNSHTKFTVKIPLTFLA